MLAPARVPLEQMLLLGLDVGGDRGIRTPDLCDANAALSQLSYVPACKSGRSPLWGAARLSVKLEVVLARAASRSATDSVARLSRELSLTSTLLTSSGRQFAPRRFQNPMMNAIANRLERFGFGHVDRFPLSTKSWKVRGSPRHEPPVVYGRLIDRINPLFDFVQQPRQRCYIHGALDEVDLAHNLANGRNQILPTWPSNDVHIVRPGLKHFDDSSELGSVR